MKKMQCKLLTIKVFKNLNTKVIISNKIFSLNLTSRVHRQAVTADRRWGRITSAQCAWFFSLCI